MELFAAAHVVFITSLLLSVFRLITCQDQVQTPANVSVIEGETAIIDCQFDRSNFVALDWKKGGDVNSAAPLYRLFKTVKIPGDDPRFDITSDYSLMINETTQADSGVYWCQVTLQGVFQSSTNLIVSPVVTTTPMVTTVPTTKPPPAAVTTKRRTTSSTAIHVDTDIARHSADNSSVTTTPGQETTGQETTEDASKSTNQEPKKQTSNNTTLYIIIGACGGVVSLAIVVLICYCCCCKRKTPNGYAKANPNTPV